MQSLDVSKRQGTNIVTTEPTEDLPIEDQRKIEETAKKLHDAHLNGKWSEPVSAHHFMDIVMTWLEPTDT